MRKNIAFAFTFIFILILARTSFAVEESRKVSEMGAEDCEFEMLVLDGFTNHLANESDATGYIIVYGGRRDTKRDEVQIRGSRIKRYLVETRGINLNRIEVVNGGYREKFRVELWLVPRGERMPEATPTVNEKEVRFKKGKMDRYREPGCFPGKYVVRKARPA